MLRVEYDVKAICLSASEISVSVRRFFTETKTILLDTRMSNVLDIESSPTWIFVIISKMPLSLIRIFGIEDAFRPMVPCSNLD